jgi:hypothetical protein
MKLIARRHGRQSNIAKANLEFEYGTTARIKVRPIKMKGENTHAGVIRSTS